MEKGGRGRKGEMGEERENSRMIDKESEVYHHTLFA